MDFSANTLISFNIFADFDTNEYVVNVSNNVDGSRNAGVHEVGRFNLDDNDPNAAVGDAIRDHLLTLGDL